MRNKSVQNMGIILLFLILPASSLIAENFSDRISWSVNGSILYFPEDNGNAGDPAPILPSLGAVLALQINSLLWLELSEDLYFTNYAYNYTLDRAVPAAIENRSAFVFGFITGIQVLGRFPMGRNMDLRFYGGPAADFRIIALALNLHKDDFSGQPETDAQIQTDSIREYFWGKARWFLPVAGIGLDFVINEKFLLGLDMRVWFPLYRLSSGEELPPIEGWRFGLGIRISPFKSKSAFRLRSQSESAESDTEQIEDVFTDKTETDQIGEP